MYHYVREKNLKLPYFTFLNKDNFYKQLHFFKTEFGFVKRDVFLNWIRQPWHSQIPEGVLLTFDDGFREHYEIVDPILRELGTWGIFYIPTSILDKTKILNVHQVHILIGHCSGEVCWRALNNLDLKTQGLKTPPNIPYTRQADSSDATKDFKRTINYLLDHDAQSKVLGELSKKLILEVDWLEFTESYYLEREMIEEMTEYGHCFGSHSKSHKLLSSLSELEQRQEIETSLIDIEKIDPHSLRSFCFPYGGSNSFNSLTESILNELKVSFAFSVENRDITESDLIHRKLALPRYDCNFFPYGATDPIPRT